MRFTNRLVVICLTLLWIAAATLMVLVVWLFSIASRLEKRVDDIKPIEIHEWIKEGDADERPIHKSRED